MRHVTCNLCPLRCPLKEGQRGQCGVRGNRDGKIKLLVYGDATTIISGVVEQKPFYHFRPGMRVLSVGGKGCNMKCGFCQNFEISQTHKAPSEKIMPDDVVRLAKENSCEGVVFTYNEPMVWFEYVIDVCEAARAAGLRTLLKTNGYASITKFGEVVSRMDAVNVDIKGDEKSYQETCLVPFDSLNSVLGNVGVAASTCHCELSAIMTPPLDEKRFFRVLNLVRNSCGRETVLHLLRFLPDFRMRDQRPTSGEEMEQATNIARDFFDFVYVHGWRTQHTHCPACDEIIIRRKGQKVVETSFRVSQEGRSSCVHCGQPLPIVG